jgi:hypothetical protein
MRVLTKQEKAVFDAAFISIMRVATAEADTVIDIRAGGRPLPGVYVGLMMGIGGMERMQHLFCPMHKKEAVEFLVKHCFSNRVQPREFIFDGCYR